MIINNKHWLMQWIKKDGLYLITIGLCLLAILSLSNGAEKATAECNAYWQEIYNGNKGSDKDTSWTSLWNGTEVSEVYTWRQEEDTQDMGFPQG